MADTEVERMNEKKMYVGTFQVSVCKSVGGGVLSWRLMVSLVRNSCINGSCRYQGSI